MPGFSSGILTRNYRTSGRAGYTVRIHSSDIDQMPTRFLVRATNLYIVWHHENRTRCVADNGLRHAAQNHPV